MAVGTVAAIAVVGMVLRVRGGVIANRTGLKMRISTLSFGPGPHRPRIMLLVQVKLLALLLLLLLLLLLVTAEEVVVAAVASVVVVAVEEAGGRKIAAVGAGAGAGAGGAGAVGVGAGGFVDVRVMGRGRGDPNTIRVTQRRTTKAWARSAMAA